MNIELLLSSVTIFCGGVEAEEEPTRTRIQGLCRAPGVQAWVPRPFGDEQSWNTRRFDANQGRALPHLKLWFGSHSMEKPKTKP